MAAIVAAIVAVVVAVVVSAFREKVEVVFVAAFLAASWLGWRLCAKRAART